ncbi:toll/interleukin-1 receptor domain-containing protein [Pseudomonas cichorii]|nr:toll/interleukin-1 receptor domain-containing protein [Pseudomonas cichorii]MBX8508392.1 toll/interleukin-1 receptor domain-containing protein [Pseudomonas cichorii]MBX8523269.1 toll/interleukin-1 receptor domain-containing protein [Pseudomonas cichorii]MBX8540713.1 toll/interleukin-1 receptor domain-containing protein [Pseudomonas cichorii]MBX8543818.1 toll/interleukin-1 receptor domain-containing protein [Pseudomonas cichorii]MBX8550071.1 toll/interleukin-1 receptor domain-containing prot
MYDTERAHKLSIPSSGELAKAVLIISHHQNARIDMSPKVFVSHASEDKDRFVLDFAKQLRANGIDAWLDKWEMLPGDSLVTKIFDEGIKDAQAVIVVLSKNSISKPWVKYELDAACVKRINTGSKLIPVIIDECEVPEALKSTLWESIQDTDSYQSSLERIVASIFGVSEKPALGRPPAYVSSFGSSVAGHNKVDSLVCTLACEFAMSTGSRHINLSAFYKDSELIIPENQLRDSIEVLGEHGTFDLQHFLGGEMPSISLTDTGFESYAREHITDYDAALLSVISAVVNNGYTRLSQIKENLDLNPFLIEHFLRVLVGEQKISATWFLDGDCLISKISPSLRRTLQ